MLWWPSPRSLLAATTPFSPSRWFLFVWRKREKRIMTHNVMEENTTALNLAPWLTSSFQHGRESHTHTHTHAICMHRCSLLKSVLCYAQTHTHIHTQKIRVVIVVLLSVMESYLATSHSFDPSFAPINTSSRQSHVLFL